VEAEFCLFLRPINFEWLPFFSGLLFHGWNIDFSRFIGCRRLDNLLPDSRSVGWRLLWLPLFLCISLSLFISLSSSLLSVLWRLSLFKFFYSSSHPLSFQMARIPLSMCNLYFMHSFLCMTIVSRRTFHKYLVRHLPHTSHHSSGLFSAFCVLALLLRMYIMYIYIYYVYTTFSFSITILAHKLICCLLGGNLSTIWEWQFIRNVFSRNGGL
jgi:hypothetical protein